MHIYLLGFMGCGKTTLGKKIAARLGRPFIDLDEKIEEMAGQPVKTIFEQAGEAHFRKLEQQALEAVAAQQEAVVIATGGGTPCFFDNMELINRTGASIYLKGSPRFLCSRLQRQQADRPLIADLEKDDLLPYIKKLLAQREPWYLHAHLVLETLNLSPAALASRLRGIGKQGM